MKKEIKQDDVYEDTRENEGDDWLPSFSKIDSFTIVFYARFSMRLEQFTNFGMKDCLGLPNLG